MNWDAIGAIGEVIGGGAVIITLIYLAAQVRDNTRVSESEAYRDGTAIWNDVFEMLMNADGQLLMSALRSYKDLEPFEKQKFDTLMVTVTTALESNLAMIDGNVLDDEANIAVEGFLKRYFAYEGTLEWWESGKSGCAPDVQAWIDSRFPKPDLEYDYWGIREHRD